jgi:hypothetical protein
MRLQMDASTPVQTNETGRRGFVASWIGSHSPSFVQTVAVLIGT